jgi:hypothetical protein
MPLVCSVQKLVCVNYLPKKEREMTHSPVEKTTRTLAVIYNTLEGGCKKKLIECNKVCV